VLLFVLATKVIDNFSSPIFIFSFLFCLATFFVGFFLFIIGLERGTKQMYTKKVWFTALLTKPAISFYLNPFIILSMKMKKSKCTMRLEVRAKI